MYERMISMKNSLKIIALFATVAVIALSFAGCVLNTNPAVRVNDTDLTKDEYSYYLYIQLSQTLQEAGVNVNDTNAIEKYLDGKTDGEKNIDIIREKAADECAKLLVQYNKAIEMGIELTEEEKNNLLTDISHMKQQTGGDAGYKAQLASLGTTPEAFEALYEKNLVIEKLFKKLVSDGTMAVTDAEVEEYIHSNYIKAAHILFMTQDQQTGASFDEETINQKRQQAQDTLTKIKNGEDFNTLMHDLSEDTGLEAYPDGYEFTKGQMVPQFEEAAFALGENEVSDIVETSYGFHIIKRLPFEITSEKVEQYKADAKIACEYEKFEALTDEWSKDAQIKIFKSVIKKTKANI